MYEMDLTTLYHVKEHIEMPQDASGEDALLRSLIRNVSGVIATYLDRHTLREARTEYLDVKDGQRRLFLRGWPVKFDGLGVPLVEIWNDNSLPPSFAAADKLVINDDFVVYPEERKMGRVYFDNFINGGPRALKVTYTAGMATKPSIEGIDGQCSDPGGSLDNRFTSASATFNDDEVVAGDKLFIRTEGNNFGVFTITNIVSQTECDVSPAFPTVPLNNQEWEVITAGLVGRYPDIGLACNMQVSYLYKIKDTPEVSSVSIAGTTTNIVQTRHQDIKQYGAQGLRADVQALLSRYRHPEVTGIGHG